MKDIKIFSIGHILVDFAMKTSRENMYHLGIKVGVLNLFDKEKISEIKKKLNPKDSKITSYVGGSCFNTIRCLASISRQNDEKDIRISFSGSIGVKDYEITFFKEYFDKLNINNLCVYYDDVESDVSLILVDEYSEKTMNTYLKVNYYWNYDNIKEHLNERYDVFYITSYILDNKINQKDIFKCVEDLEAKNPNLLKIIDLTSVEIIKRNRDFLFQMLPKFKVFLSNKEEFETFFGNSIYENKEFDFSNVSPNLYIDKIFIVKDGKNGAFILENNKKSILIPNIFKVALADLTGSGDIFNSGFIYGYLRNWKLENAVLLGHFLASRVISKIGVDISYFEKNNILEEFQIFVKKY